MALAARYNSTPPTFKDGDLSEVLTDANGRPVVVGASGSPLPMAGTFVEQAGLSAGALNADLVPSTDVSAYRWISLHIINMASGGNISFQISNDNVTWGPTILYASNVLDAGHTSNNFSNSLYHGPVVGRYFRARQTSWTSGSTTGVLELYTAAPALGSLGVTAGQSGTWNMVLKPGSSGGPTLSRIKSAASTNSTNVKGSAGQIYGWALYNSTASAKFFKVYNKATAPTVGTDTPAFTTIIPANGQSIQSFENGIPLGTGIGYGITGAIADTDTTSTAVDDVHGLILTN